MNDGTARKRTSANVVGCFGATFICVPVSQSRHVIYFYTQQQRCTAAGKAGMQAGKHTHSLDLSRRTLRDWNAHARTIIIIIIIIIIATHWSLVAKSMSCVNFVSPRCETKNRNNCSSSRAAMTA